MATEVYARDSLVDLIRNRALNFAPTMVGNGPFDLSPDLRCELCGDAFVLREWEGNISAFALGVWARTEDRWLAFHPRCVRDAEAGNFWCPLEPCSNVRGGWGQCFDSIVEYHAHLEEFHFASPINAPAPLVSLPSTHAASGVSGRRAPDAVPQGEPA